MSLKLSLSTLKRYLLPASLGYLAFPYAIFFVGWLKWYYALLGVGLVVLPLICAIRETNQRADTQPEEAKERSFGWRQLLWILGVAAVFLGFSGVGGYGFQDTDWIKHNALLRDLITHPWPVDYELGGQAVPLVYYIAYYLPAALAGKLGGWLLANQVLFGWSLIGLMLALLWFVVLIRRFSVRLLLLFVLFSGLDGVGQSITWLGSTAFYPDYLAIFRWDHIEQWSFGWQYSANATLLFWVPHQALVGWIASGLLLHNLLDAQPRKYSLLVLSLTTLWSPFVTLGLLPFLLTEFWLTTGGVVKRVRAYISLPNVCGVVLAAVIGWYYSAKLYPVAGLLNSDIPAGFSLSFAPDDEARLVGLGLMLLFCLLEFGLYGMILWRRPDWERPARLVLAVTLVCLLLYPLYRYGSTNDFVMRVSIPALFVLAVFVGRALQRPHRLLVVLLVLGSVTALFEFGRHAAGMLETRSLYQLTPIEQVTSLNQWGLSTAKDASLLLQYVGSAEAPFFKFVVRERR